MRGYTPAYFLVPAQPEQWRILATLPESGETNAAERPYLMARPFGKGIVIVLALDPWFSIPCTISNIIMNRDEIFKPDDAVPEKAVSENEKGKQTIQTDADQKKRKTNSDRKKQTEKITENERSFDEKTIESHGI